MLGMHGSGAEARLALALLCALAIAHAHDKRAESESGIVSPVPFTFAARYGRSPDRFITPRIDRWMMTTRYGKRSGSYATEEDPLSHEGPPASRESRHHAGGVPAGGGWLSCEYTGVLELYRCRSLPRAQLARRSDDDDPAPSE